MQYRDFDILRTVSRAVSLLLVAIMFVACTSDIIPATGERRYLGYTWQQETELGKEASKQVAALFGVYRDPKLERYVNEVGNRVLATSHLRRPNHQCHGSPRRLYLCHSRNAQPP
jgi:predicted Zn-dependent protease